MTRCDRCARLLDETSCVWDDAGAWCEECYRALGVESLAAVGGRRLIEAEVAANRAEREYVEDRERGMV